MNKNISHLLKDIFCPNLIEPIIYRGIKIGLWCDEENGLNNFFGKLYNLNENNLELIKPFIKVIINKKISDEKIKYILLSYYGLIDSQENSKNISSIAKELGLCSAKIYQLKADGIRQLRYFRDVNLITWDYHPILYIMGINLDPVAMYKNFYSHCNIIDILTCSLETFRLFENFSYYEKRTIIKERIDDLNDDDCKKINTILLNFINSNNLFNKNTIFFIINYYGFNCIPKSFSTILEELNLSTKITCRSFNKTIGNTLRKACLKNNSIKDAWLVPCISIFKILNIDINKN